MIRPVVGASYYIGVQENNEASALRLYPNPAQSTLHIEDNFKSGQVSIYDLTGRKVYQSVFHTEIPVNQLNEGLYFLSITTNEGQVITQKFVIQK